MQDYLCDVCDKNQALGIASCFLGIPTSHAYCRECLEHNAEKLIIHFYLFDKRGPDYYRERQDTARRNSFHNNRYIHFEEIVKLWKLQRN